MSLSGYIVRRLLQAVPVALGVTILVFLLIHLVPGDPARTILGNQATAPRVALLRHEWGLDRRSPCNTRSSWAGSHTVTSAQSLFYGVNAGQLVVERLPVTLWLIGLGGLFSVLIAVPLAVIAATHRDRTPTTSSESCRSSASASRPSGSGSCCCSSSGCTRAVVSGRRVRRRIPRPPALDDPAGADRRARDLADPDP